MGRARLYHTPEEQAEARRRHKKTARTKTRNITLDVEVQTLLQAMQDRLAEHFGFTPTLSQTVRYALAHCDLPKEPK